MYNKGIIMELLKSFYTPVTQLDRVSVYETESQRFESSQACQFWRGMVLTVARWIPNPKVAVQICVPLPITKTKEVNDI